MADIPPRKSVVDYSKVSDRPLSHLKTAAAAPSSTAAAAAASSQDAILRLLTGKESRTIAEKITDTNRPTWEQYKKDNKLEFGDVDAKKMEEYRKELDKQRDAILARGINHEDLRKKKKRKKKRRYSSTTSSSSSSTDRSREHESSRRHRDKKSKRRKKKHHKKQRDKEKGDESDGSHYRLSSFFHNDDD